MDDLITDSPQIPFGFTDHLYYPEEPRSSIENISNYQIQPEHIHLNIDELYWTGLPTRSDDIIPESLENVIFPTLDFDDPNIPKYDF